MSDPQTFDLDQLVRNAAMSADTVAIELRDSVPPAQLTRAIIRRTLEALLANGLIEIKPLAEWPDSYFIDPPYASLAP